MHHRLSRVEEVDLRNSSAGGRARVQRSALQSPARRSQSALNDADCFLTLPAITGFISAKRTFRAPRGRKSYTPVMWVPPSRAANE